MHSPALEGEATLSDQPFLASGSHCKGNKLRACWITVSKTIYTLFTSVNVPTRGFVLCACCCPAGGTAWQVVSHYIQFGEPEDSASEAEQTLCLSLSAMVSRSAAHALAGVLREGHLSEKCSQEAQMRQRLFFLRRSFSSGSSLPSGPKTLERLGFCDFDELVAGVYGLGAFLC